MSKYDLRINGSDECNNTNGYNNACSHMPDSTDLSIIGNGANAKDIGAWYNYTAASVGTIAGNNNSNPTTSDICPSGWHLPSGPANDTNSESYKLFQNTNSGWVSPNNYLVSFVAVNGGNYYNSTLRDTEKGYWWSSTPVNVSSRHNQYYNSSDENFYGSGGSARYHGMFIRCIRTS